MNLLTVEEFCTRNKISRSFFYNEHSAGKIETIKVGRKTLISMKSESDWLVSKGVVLH